ncbi:hypothetical protein [Bacteroides fluxus]|jgi:hypothetical protein
MAIKYLVGIDFGHGETTASCYKIDEEIVTHLKINDSTNGDAFKIESIVYQIFQKDGSCFYQLNPGTGCAIHISFKDNVCELNKNKEKKEAFQNFIRLVYERIKEYNRFLTENGNEFLLYIACPTKWNENDKKDYKEFVEKAINQPIEWVINESDAAYFNKKKDGLVLVVDFGSSTIDYTLMHNNKKINIDHLSNRLGARHIECDLLKYYKSDTESNYKNRKEKSEIIKLRSGNQHLDIDTALKLELRTCKEYAYSKKLLFIHFRAYIEQQYMGEKEEDAGYEKNFASFEKQYINFYIKEVVYNFNVVKNEVYKRCKELNIDPSQLQIILSGGASIMPWVRKSLQEIFNTEIEKDGLPEYIVSDGIVKYAYALWNVKTKLSEITDKFHNWFSTAESDLKDMIQKGCRETCLERTKNDPNIIDYCSANFKDCIIPDTTPENPYHNYYKSSIKGFMSIVDEVNRKIYLNRKSINDKIYRRLNQKLHDSLYEGLHQVLLDTLQKDINQMTFLQNQSFLPTINNDFTVGSNNIKEISEYCVKDLGNNGVRHFTNTGYGDKPLTSGSYRKKRIQDNRKRIAESYYKYIESKSFAPYSDEELKQIKDGIYSQVMDAIIKITNEHLTFNPCGYDLKKELFSKDKVAPQKENTEDTISHNSTSTDTEVENVFSMTVTYVAPMGSDLFIEGEIKSGKVAKGDTLFIGYDHLQMVHVKEIFDNEIQVGGIVRMLLDCNHTLIKTGATVHSKTF